MVLTGTPWTQIRLPMRIYRIPKGFCICLKIMVSPVRIRVPPLKKVLQIPRKIEAPGAVTGGLAAMRQQ